MQKYSNNYLVERFFTTLIQPLVDASENNNSVTSIDKLRNIAYQHMLYLYYYSQGLGLLSSLQIESIDSNVSRGMANLMEIAEYIGGEEEEEEDIDVSNPGAMLRAELKKIKTRKELLQLVPPALPTLTRQYIHPDDLDNNEQLNAKLSTIDDNITGILVNLLGNSNAAQVKDIVPRRLKDPDKITLRSRTKQLLADTDLQQLKKWLNGILWLDGKDGTIYSNDREIDYSSLDDETKMRAAFNMLLYYGEENKLIYRGEEQYSQLQEKINNELNKHWTTRSLADGQWYFAPRIPANISPTALYQMISTDETRDSLLQHFAAMVEAEIKYLPLIPGWNLLIIDYLSTDEMSILLTRGEQASQYGTGTRIVPQKQNICDEKQRSLLRQLRQEWRDYVLNPVNWDLVTSLNDFDIVNKIRQELMSSGVDAPFSKDMIDEYLSDEYKGQSPTSASPTNTGVTLLGWLIAKIYKDGIAEVAKRVDDIKVTVGTLLSDFIWDKRVISMLTYCVDQSALASILDIASQGEKFNLDKIKAIRRDVNDKQREIIKGVERQLLALLNSSDKITVKLDTVIGKHSEL